MSKLTLKELNEMRTYVNAGATLQRQHTLEIIDELIDCRLAPSRHIKDLMTVIEKRIVELEAEMVELVEQLKYGVTVRSKEHLGGQIVELKKMKELMLTIYELRSKE